MAPGEKDSQQFAQVRPGTAAGGANAQDLTSVAQGSAAAAVAAASDAEMRPLLARKVM